MSGIKTMTIKSGATMAPTGGTDLVFASDGITVANGCSLTVPAVASLALRPKATVKYRPSVISSDGSFTKDKKSVSYAVPFTTSKGTISFRNIRVEREIHPEDTAANALDLNVIMAQILTDSEAANFWAAGSLDS